MLCILDVFSAKSVNPMVYVFDLAGRTYSHTWIMFTKSTSTIASNISPGMLSILSPFAVSIEQQYQSSFCCFLFP